MKTPKPYLLLACLLLGLCVPALSAFETVVIDAGHGGNDEGTKWYHVAEKDVALEVAKRLETVLTAKGIKVVQTRTDDSYKSLIERAEVANASDNSLLVSIHFNSTRVNPTSTGGFQTYHFFASPSSQIIAESIQSALAEKLAYKNRGVLKNDFAVLTRTNDLAVLVECGFISNKEEAMYFNTATGQQTLAEALAVGIMRVKPVINNDPIACLEAKAALIAKRDAAIERKLLLSGLKKPGKPADIPSPSLFAVMATAPAKQLMVSVRSLINHKIESTASSLGEMLRRAVGMNEGDRERAAGEQ